jgi:hypothetical protein
MTLILLSAAAAEAAEPAPASSASAPSATVPATPASGPATAAAAAPTPPAKSAVTPAAAKKKSDDPGSQWVFSLLPKSLQKNPKVEMTVITEMTDAGKQRPEATPQSPAYFLAQSAGFHSLGDGTSRDKGPLPAVLEGMLKKALASNGYLPSDPPAHPPSLLLVYSWGAHYALHPEEDDSISAEMVERNILDRAGLVGGPQFAQKLLKLFEQKAALLEANPPPRPDPTGINPGIEPILGDAQKEFADPIRLFAQESPKNSFIIDQAFDDVYFVVASAYDYAAAGQNQRRLLWRTRMTVDSKGVAMIDTLPTLIDTAAPYFGREMTEPETLIKRALKEGNVEVGTPRVIPDNKTH